MSRAVFVCLLMLFCCLGAFCQDNPADAKAPDVDTLRVHVTVALCDNENQGIVPVPASLGNGQDAKNNLYWGAAFGVKTFFKKQGWKKLQSSAPLPEGILDRVVWEKVLEVDGKRKRVLVLAEAWDGALISDAIFQFLRHSAGLDRQMISLEGEEKPFAFGGGAQVVAYVGHDGLMEFSLPHAKDAEGQNPESMILACISKDFFMPYLKKTGSPLLLGTTGLMAPEAYTLEAAILAKARDASTEQVREAAAHAYHRYQKCGLKAARRLFDAPVGGPKAQQP